MLKHLGRLSNIVYYLKQDSNGIYFKQFLDEYHEREIEMSKGVADID